MNIDTPEGALTVDDEELKFVPSDGGPELRLSISPMPDYRYERGVYGLGTLVVGGQVIVLRNDQASSVIEELRRPRTASKAARRSADAAKSDSDEATSK